MIKKFLVFVCALSFAAAFAATEVNQASEAELDGFKGIGPSTTRLIIAEREKSEFRSWEDFIKRVKGMGSKNAIKYSAQGLTVDGAAYTAVGNATSGVGKATE